MLYNINHDLYQPEVYERKKLEEWINDVYDCCSADGCDECPFNEKNQEYCQPNIIMELWRRLNNAEYKLREFTKNEESKSI